MADPTAVYRLHDEHGELLYVGITDHLRRRWQQHAKDKPWWPSVAYADTVWYDTRAQAELCEQEAIEDECPPFNRNMSPWRVGVSATKQAGYQAAHNRLAAEVFIALEEGHDLRSVAQAAGWSPRYITQLRERRRPTWAREYVAQIRDGKVKEPS